ncbi:glycosyltransferase family 39 protein [Magnetospirillum sp. UT-4]|uniref:glycosyltransferase family 39 protein n=1 Tax=Magnetospirillum sp. UT-4 TaxID=2681467 RepID=UPI00137FE97F|nr:glycosyltransferase family 39 protein [Magnetospirillum sp. UT-4]CAA7621649.1 conserved membrane hypothetical protein [Magnetospirillum sp. UT-4]
MSISTDGIGRGAALPRWLVWAAAVIALWGVGNLLAVVITYQLYPGYVELNESSLTIMARFLIEGLPVYRGLDSPDRVTHVHGPLIFFLTALPQWLFGDSVASGRMAASLAAVLLPVVVALRHRRQGVVAMALAAAFAAWAFLTHLNMTVVPRPDMPVAVLTALAVAAVAWGERGGGWKASALLGLCAGAAIGFKVTAPVFILPVALFHLAGDPVRRILVSGAAALLVAALPFAHPSVPFQEYLAMMAPMAGKENTWFAFSKLALKFGFYLAIPLAAWLLAGRQAWRTAGWRLWLYLGTYSAMVVLMLAPATKPGAGHYYYLPFVAPMVDLSLRALAAAGAARRRTAAALAAAAALCLGLAWQQERRFFKALDWDEARAATADIRQIMADFPGKRIQMGLGGVTVGDPLNVRLYAYRSLLAAAGHPYTLDLNTVMELGWLRIPMPEETYRRLETCHTDLWLLPHGEPPFTLNGYYYEPAFNKRFQTTFRAHHDRVAEYRIFDVWACHTDARSPAPAPRPRGPATPTP